MGFNFFPAENICFPKSDPKLGVIDLGTETKMESYTKKGQLILLDMHNTGKCTTQGDAQHRELHNTGRCTTQGDAQHREMHNTGRCTTQGVAQHREMHNTGSLDIFRGVRAAEPPPPSMPEFPTQQHAQRSNMHNTATCTTQGDAQRHSSPDINLFLVCLDPPSGGDWFFESG